MSMVKTGLWIVVCVVLLFCVIFIVVAPIHGECNDHAFHKHLGIPGLIHINKHGKFNGKNKSEGILHLQRHRSYCVLLDCGTRHTCFRYCLDEPSVAEDRRLEECWEKDTDRSDMWRFRPTRSLPTHFYLCTNGTEFIDVYLTH